jgi:hypothetical protein
LLLKIIATRGLLAGDAIGVLCWFNRMHMKKRAAMAGASHRKEVGLSQRVMRDT